MIEWLQSQPNPDALIVAVVWSALGVLSVWASISILRRKP